MMNLQDEILRRKQEEEKRKRLSGEEGGLGDLLFAADQIEEETQPQYVGRNLVQDLLKPKQIVEEKKPEPEIEEKKADEPKPTQTTVTEEETTQKTTTPKPKPFPKINLGESEEAKQLTAQIKTTTDELAKLQDPPMTSDELRQKAYEGLEAARKSRANTLEWAKVFEKLVGAVTKFGAAREGLARGLDMSKAEIEKTDWDSMIDRAFKEYEYDLNKLTGRYDKQDKAKADVDSKREGMTKQMADLRAKIGRARDIRKREQARLDQRRAELLQRRDEKELDRQSKLEQQRLRAEQKTNPTFYSRFTDDPKTARELASAAAISEDALASAFNRASVQENLLPGALDEFQKNKGIFGWGDKVVDTEAVREAIQQKKPQTQTQQPNQAFRMVKGPDGMYRQYTDGRLEKVE